MKERDWGHFKDGTLHIVCSSHNDIAWFDTPAKTIEWRDEKAITPALERMLRNEEVTFSMEDVLYLLEYLERHPERKEEIRRLTIDKRLDWGATYNQPYESLLSGEQLVRELYLGRRLLKDVLPGADARVYYNPDVPGRSMQMPQILKKAGVPYMLFSRHEAGLRRWGSPDGSSIVSWSMGHYGVTCLFERHLDGELDEVAAKVHGKLGAWSEEYAKRGLPPHFAFLYSMDYIPPKDYDLLIEEWNSARETMGGAPRMRYSTPEQFLDSVMVGDPSLEVICGERPNVWLYIHGPSHHHAITAKREAGRLLPAAEAFSTFEALLAGTFAGYPARELEMAWALSIYDDHGWGGNNGHATDEAFRQKLIAGRDLSEEILGRAQTAIAQRVDTEPGRGLSIVVFNSLSWSRSDPVHCTVPLANSEFVIEDAKGNPVPHQRIPAGTGLGNEVVFIARDLSALGYRTYYISEQPRSATLADLPGSVSVDETSFENDFYRVELAPGGVKSLFDKELGCELLNGSKFLGCELFMLESTGNGAGEFDSIQQPTSVGDFDKTSNHQPYWAHVQSGPVFSEYQLTQQLAHCLVVQKLTIYHSVKRLDCDISLLNWDGSKSREFRMALPLAIENAEIAYEVPMGVLEVGRHEIQGQASSGPVYTGVSPDTGTRLIGPAYRDDSREVRPREVQNFISATGPTFGVTMSSSVAVCDYQDPTLAPVSHALLQPVLLASRKSCHPNGNWYQQAGDHHFSFSITSHAPNWRNGYRRGIQANHPLRAVWPRAGSDTCLPPSRSFLSVESGNHVISAVKKAADDDGIIIRCYDIEGSDERLELSLAFTVESAQRTNLLEEAGVPVDNGRNQLGAEVGKYAIETFRLKAARRL